MYFIGLFFLDASQFTLMEIFIVIFIAVFLNKVNVNYRLHTIERLIFFNVFLLIIKVFKLVIIDFGLTVVDKIFEIVILFSSFVKDF